MNRRGFSLVEVLITLGLVGLIGIGITNLLTSQMKTVRRMELLLSKLQIEKMVTKTFEHEEACMNTFGGRMLKIVPPENTGRNIDDVPLRDGDNQVFLDLHQIIEKLEVARTELLIDNAGTSPTNGSLRIYFESPMDPEGTLGPIEMSMRVAYDAAHRVTACGLGLAGQGLAPGQIGNCRPAVSRPLSNGGNTTRTESIDYSCITEFGAPPNGHRWMLQSVYCRGYGSLLENFVNERTFRCTDGEDNTIQFHLDNAPNPPEVHFICCEHNPAI